MGRNALRMTQWGAALVVLTQTPALAAEPAPPSTAVPIVVEHFTSSAVPIVDSHLVKPASLFQHATYPGAWTAAQKTNRPILVFVSMPNCPHCVKMVNETYHQPKIERMVGTSFETIKADRYAHAKLVSKLHIKWYPTTVLVGPNNKILDVIEGYVGPKEFQQRLQTGLASIPKPAVTKTR